MKIFSRSLQAFALMFAAFAPLGLPASPISAEIIVSLPDQELALLDRGKLAARYSISTSKFGTGDSSGSYRTPIGVLFVSGKFGDKLPAISSTKGLTGHAIGASGAHEAIYCLLMLEHGFIAACANLEEPDPAIRGLPIVDKMRAASLNAVMSNSLGFGGTNASLIFRRWQGKPG